MVPSPSVIRAFRPFSLQHRQRSDEMWQDVQEFIYYGESRFRAIILAILLALPENRKWMQLRLRNELFVITGFIGLMTAVGRVVDIPLVIRSLVDGLAFLDQDYFPAVFHTDLIQMIEAGTGQKHGKVVRKYHLQWWTKAKEPDTEFVMSQENISLCLDYYEQQLKKEGDEILPVSIIPNPQLGDLETDDDGTDGDAAISAAECDFLAGQSTQQIKDLLNSVNGYRHAAEGKVQLSARRVASLYLLFNQITLKETADTPTAGPIAPGKKGQAAEFLRRKSLTLFKAQENIQTEGSQWTSGTRLTRNEVLDLVHVPFQEEHSGYHSLQSFGSLSGVDSPWAVPGDVASQGVYSEYGKQRAAASGADNTVYPRPRGFYPQRPLRKIPSDDKAREAYLTSHPEIREEMDQAWKSNSAQWDKDGFYYGDLSNRIDSFGAGIGATGQPDQDMDLGSGMHATSLAVHTGPRGILDLYQDSDSDVEMASPLPNEHGNKSIADLFDDDDDNSEENSCNDSSIPPTNIRHATSSFADLYNSDTGGSGPQTRKQPSMADLYAGDTENSEPESDKSEEPHQTNESSSMADLYAGDTDNSDDKPQTSERVSMADLYDGDTDDSTPASPSAMSRSVQQSAAATRAAPIAAKPAAQKVFTMADFEYVEEDEFADILSGSSIRESDSD